MIDECPFRQGHCTEARATGSTVRHMVFALQCFYNNEGDPTESIGEYLTAAGHQLKPDHSLIDPKADYE